MEVMALKAPASISSDEPDSSRLESLNSVSNNFH